MPDAAGRVPACPFPDHGGDGAASPAQAPQNAVARIYCDYRNSWRTLQIMAAHDLCADVAALLNPIPAPGGMLADEALDTAAEEALRERDERAEALRLAWSGDGSDPLLTALADLCSQRLRIEAEMRQLIAYGRRFTHPRPYKLIDLAGAAGMSISGVRTAYEAEEVEQVADALGRPPATSTG